MRKRLWGYNMCDVGGEIKTLCETIFNNWSLMKQRVEEGRRERKLTVPSWPALALVRAWEGRKDRTALMLSGDLMTPDSPASLPLWGPRLGGEAGAD